MREGLLKRFGDWNPNPGMQINIRQEATQMDQLIFKALMVLKQGGKIASAITKENGKNAYKLTDDGNYRYAETFQDVANMMDREDTTKLASMIPDTKLARRRYRVAIGELTYPEEFNALQFTRNDRKNNYVCGRSRKESPGLGSGGKRWSDKKRDKKAKRK